MTFMALLGVALRRNKSTAIQWSVAVAEAPDHSGIAERDGKPARTRGIVEVDLSERHVPVEHDRDIRITPANFDGERFGASRPGRGLESRDVADCIERTAVALKTQEC